MSRTEADVVFLSNKPRIFLKKTFSSWHLYFDYTRCNAYSSLFHVLQHSTWRSSQGKVEVSLDNLHRGEIVLIINPAVPTAKDYRIWRTVKDLRRIIISTYPRTSDYDAEQCSTLSSN